MFANTTVSIVLILPVQNWLQGNWRWLVPVALGAVLILLLGAKLWRPRSKRRINRRSAIDVYPGNTGSITVEDQEESIRPVVFTSAIRSDAAKTDEQEIPELPPVAAGLSPLPEVKESKVEPDNPKIPIEFERTELELKKLLAGHEYDASLIDVSDTATRQAVAAGLISALASRSFEQHEPARRAFLDYGYFDETTRDLRSADSPTERAAAARKLGIIRDSRGIAHLIAALYDTAPEVRRAVVESLGQTGDNTAIEPLNELMQREGSRLLPEAVIRHAINSITVTEVKRSTTERPALRVVEKTTPVDQLKKLNEEFPSFSEVLKADSEAPAEGLASVAPTVPAVPSLPVVTPPPVESQLNEKEIQLEQQALLSTADELNQQRELEAARQRSEEESQVNAERDAHARAETEAQMRSEEEARMRAAEEERLGELEEESALKVEPHVQAWAEEAARIQAEEDPRFRLEAETLRRAAEELARKRSAAELARKIAEDEGRQRGPESVVDAPLLAVQEETLRDAEPALLQRSQAEAFLREAEERRRVEEERFRLEEEALVKAADEIARRRREIAAARKKLEEEAHLLAATQTRIRPESEARIAEQEWQRIDEEEQRKSEVEAEPFTAAQDRIRVEEEARRAAIEEQKRLEEVARQKAEEEAGLLAAVQQRIVAEEKARQASEEERLRIEAKARERAEVERKRFEETRERVAAEQKRIEAEIRQHAEEEERRLVELHRVKRAAEEQLRQREEQEKRIRSEIESLLQAGKEQRQRIEAATRRRVEAEASLREERNRRQIEDEARSQAEQQAQFAGEARNRSEEETRRAERQAEETRLQLEREARVPEEAEAQLRAERMDVVGPETAESASSTDSPARFANDESGQGIDPIRAERVIATVAEESNISAELLHLLNSESSVERSVALDELAKLGGEDAFRIISRSFDDPSVDVRSAAALALYDFQGDRAASFTRALREGSPERRRNIGAALAGSGLAQNAIAKLTGESREKTYNAFSLLFLMAKAGELQPLIEAIEEHPDVEVRLAVVKLLALSGQPEIVPTFRRLAVRGSLPSEVRSAVMQAIYQASSQSEETTTSVG